MSPATTNVYLKLSRSIILYRREKNTECPRNFRALPQDSQGGTGGIEQKGGGERKWGELEGGRIGGWENWGWRGRWREEWRGRDGGEVVES
jgi:hypothetical protein